jgi:HK97 family phage portal protein
VNVFGQASVASNPDSAMQVPTVWACVKLLADTVSSMPLETYRKASNVPQRITDPSIVLNPDPDETQSEWLHALMVSLLLRGNAYALMSGVGAGMNLTLLNPDMVHVTVDRNTGMVTYKVGQAQQDMTGRIWHVRGLTLPGQKMGLTPIGYAASTIGIDLAARKFAGDFYRGEGLPKGVLTSDQPINQEQATTLKQRLVEASRDRAPVALGLGAKYELLPIRAEESQFLATQEFNIGQISRFFGVPAEMVGGKSGDSLTYSTVELNSLNFLTYGVQFWLKRIEDSFFKLLPGQQCVRFNTQLLLRTDAVSQVKVDAIAVAAKIRAPSEIRTERGWQPFTQDEKDELSLIPLTINPSNGTPKVLPAPPVDGAYDASDLIPDDNPKPAPKAPKQGAKNG